MAKLFNNQNEHYTSHNSFALLPEICPIHEHSVTVKCICNNTDVSDDKTIFTISVNPKNILLYHTDNIIHNDNNGQTFTWYSNNFSLSSDYKIIEISGAINTKITTHYWQGKNKYNDLITFTTKNVNELPSINTVKIFVQKIDWVPTTASLSITSAENIKYNDTSTQIRYSEGSKLIDKYDTWIIKDNPDGTEYGTTTISGFTVNTELTSRQLLVKYTKNSVTATTSIIQGAYEPSNLSIPSEYIPLNYTSLGVVPITTYFGPEEFSTITFTESFNYTYIEKTSTINYTDIIYSNSNIIANCETTTYQNTDSISYTETVNYNYTNSLNENITGSITIYQGAAGSNTNGYDWIAQHKPITVIGIYTRKTGTIIDTQINYIENETIVLQQDIIYIKVIYNLNYISKNNELKSIEKTSITMLSSQNAQFNIILNAPSFADVPQITIKCIINRKGIISVDTGSKED